MKKNFKFILRLSAISTVIPGITVACNNSKSTQKSNVNTADELKQKIESLSKNDQIKLISSLNLSVDEKADLIAKLNSGAGIVASLVWYMNSAEQRLASLQAYALATQAYDNLKTQNIDGFDYTKVNSDTGLVTNPDAGKAIPVVFMDIDETVFVNEYTETAVVLENDGRFIEDKKDAVDAKGNRRAVAGAINFINHVFENGGIVLFNSGIRQLEASVAGIKKNLIKAGVKPEYVHDWMFWCSGVEPISSVEGDTITYDKTPWRTAIEKFKNGTANSKATSKNQRMNAVSDNTTGWNFSEAQTGAGGAVVTKVVMKIGDDFNDFFDDAYKPEKKNSVNVEWSKKPEVENLFTDFKGTAKGVKVTREGKNDAILTGLDWNQVYVQVPGNAMYGGWTREYGYGAFTKLWAALKDIIANSQDNVESA
ncbi:HAD family acid phosphatase [Mycoplasma sp. HS2188]|uniref:HAD family acid phosphatase n=1 Tax=Mycoplasma sp. HS2188 TaxID=2976765 RepID=UPI0021A9C147|nr:HAD family acid phosphatase [Mycoplasma sp. HS2188]MCT4469571.1 hypothetical protein [Mycoplasma sp. HS2188]